MFAIWQTVPSTTGSNSETEHTVEWKVADEPAVAVSDKIGNTYISIQISLIN